MSRAPEDAAAPRVVIYCRVSTGEQAESGTSMEAQELSCLRRAAELSAQVVGIRRDPGVSGSLFLSRPGIQAALSDVETGAANILLMAKLDRSGRDVDIVRTVKRRVEAAGGRLLFADGSDFGSNAVGNLMFTQLAGFAEYERAVIRERTMSGRRRRVESGVQPIRSRSPFGYHIVNNQDVLSGSYPADQLGKYQIVPEEARLVSEMFDRYAGGSSLYDICRWLLAMGVPTPRGATVWRIQTVRCILTNPAYQGEVHVYTRRRLKDESRIEQGYKADYSRPAPPEDHLLLDAPAVVSRETFERCQNRLETAKAIYGGNPHRRYLLSSLMRCPDCGRGMTGITQRTKGRGGEPKNYTYYQCPVRRVSTVDGCGCETRLYPAGEVESAVIAVLQKAIRRPDLVAKALEAYRARPVVDLAPERTRIEKALKALAAEEKAAVKAQIAGIAQGADPTIYAEIFEDLSERRKALQSEQAALRCVETPVSYSSPRTAAEAISRALVDVEEAIRSPAIPTADKHKALALVIQEIRPEEDVYRVRMAPPACSDETIQFIGMFWRVSGEVCFEVSDAGNSESMPANNEEQAA